MNQPGRPDGRLRALYAAAAAGFDTASFLVQALWILCVFALTALVVAFGASAYNAVF